MNIKNYEITKTTIYHIPRRISMGGQRISFDIRCAVLKGHHFTLDQFMDFILQRITILDVMVGCPLMKSTMHIGFVPLRKRFRCMRRIPWLDQILNNKRRIQFGICHRNRIKSDLLPLKIIMLIVVVFMIIVSVLLLMLLLLNWCWLNYGIVGKYWNNWWYLMMLLGSGIFPQMKPHFPPHRCWIGLPFLLLRETPSILFARRYFFFRQMALLDAFF